MHAVILQPAELIRALQGPWATRAGYLINLLLVVWIAWLLSTITWKVVGTFRSAEPVPVEAIAQTVSRNQYAILVDTMPGWHLMGKASQVVPAMSTAPVDAPDTRLKLILHGVLASDQSKNARAIIADPRGKEKQYAIGDTLPGKAELSEIHADRVILFRGGRYETLRLKQDNSGRGNSATSRGRKSVSTATSKRVKEFRQRVKKDPKSLYDRVKISPKRGGRGELIGYTLNPGKDAQLFKDIGLQPGDVAIEINGEKLNNLRAGARVLQQTTDESITLVVLRNGVEETITLDLP